MKIGPLTINLAIRVRCDRCGATSIASRPTRREAEVAALHDGWSTDERHHYCPACTRRKISDRVMAEGLR